MILRKRKVLDLPRTRNVGKKANTSSTNAIVIMQSVTALISTKKSNATSAPAIVDNYESYVK